jgi:hypothetical protein
MKRRPMHKKELPDPVQVPMLPELVPHIEVGARRYTIGKNLQVLVGWSPGGWHLSISHVRRYPTWDEIAHARDKLLPKELTFVMVLPPPEEYVNLHPYCFHLWQANDMRGSGGTLAYASTDKTHQEE